MESPHRKTIERWRSGLLLARGDYRLDHIAAEIGCSPSTLTALLKQRRIGPELGGRLEEWLRKNRYWEDVTVVQADPAQYRTTTPYVIQEIARMGEGIAKEAGSPGKFNVHKARIIEGICIRLQEELLPEAYRLLEEADRSDKADGGAPS